VNVVVIAELVVADTGTIASTSQISRSRFRKVSPPNQPGPRSLSGTPSIAARFLGAFTGDPPPKPVLP